MFKLMFSLLISTLFILFNGVTFAQKQELKAPKVIHQAFERKFTLAESKIKNIEGILSRIESQKLVRDGDSESMEREMYEYAEHMKSIFDESLKSAEDAAESGGKSGNVEALNSFETMTKQHEVKLRKIEEKVKAIEAQIKTGAIKLDKPILQKMSPIERDEFHEFLTPEGRRQMQKMHPELFKPGMKSGASLEDMDKFYKNKIGCYSSIYDQFSNFFVGTAEAAVAVNCIGVCFAKKWEECLKCVRSSGSAAVEAWNDFKRCWDNCCGCKWYKPGCCSCKLGCLLKFIAKLG